MVLAIMEDKINRREAQVTRIKILNRAALDINRTSHWRESKDEESQRVLEKKVKNVNDLTT